LCVLAPECSRNGPNSGRLAGDIEEKKKGVFLLTGDQKSASEGHMWSFSGGQEKEVGRKKSKLVFFEETKGGLEGSREGVMGKGVCNPPVKEGEERCLTGSSFGGKRGSTRRKKNHKHGEEKWGYRPCLKKSKSTKKERRIPPLYCRKREGPVEDLWINVWLRENNLRLNLGTREKGGNPKSKFKGVFYR